MVKMNKTILTASLLALTILLLPACSKKTQVEPNSVPQGQTTKVSGKIVIDGSSTVFPITQAVAEEFSTIQPDVLTTVGYAGTGGGMKKFAAGEIDICDASRTIKDSEKEDAKKNSIEYVELKVAFDGITVVVNKDNNWVDSITTEELKKIWEQDSAVKKWNDINPNWPDAVIKLYGPGTDSGTFEYFTEEINKKAKAMRKDFNPSEDDNMLVKGVSGDKNAMGYFGYAYYVENQTKLKALKINGIAPDFATIKDGTYKPLSRPLYIYVNKKALASEHVKAFVNYYMTEGVKLIKDIGYVQLEDKEYTEQLSKLK